MLAHFTNVFGFSTLHESGRSLLSAPAVSLILTATYHVRIYIPSAFIKHPTPSPHARPNVVIIRLCMLRTQCLCFVYATCGRRRRRRSRDWTVLPVPGTVSVHLRRLRQRLRQRLRPPTVRPNSRGHPRRSPDADISPLAAVTAGAGAAGVTPGAACGGVVGSRRGGWGGLPGVRRGCGTQQLRHCSAPPPWH